jgi:hypothetical protein
MPNETFKRWTADDIAKLKNLAQKQSRKAIAADWIDRRLLLL